MTLLPAIETPFDLAAALWLGGAALRIAYAQESRLAVLLNKRELALSGIAAAILWSASPELAIACGWVAWRCLDAALQVGGACSLRSLLLRLVLAAQLVISAVLVAVIAVALWRGGPDLPGFAFFAILGLLMFWTAETQKAVLARRDRAARILRSASYA